MQSEFQRAQRKSHWRNNLMEKIEEALISCKAFDYSDYSDISTGDAEVIFLIFAIV